MVLVHINYKIVYSSSTTKAEDHLDSAFLDRLIEILKTASPNLQRKAASILEYVTADETLVQKLISVDIASGLDAIFQRGSVKGKLFLGSTVNTT